MTHLNLTGNPWPCWHRWPGCHLFLFFILLLDFFCVLSRKWYDLCLFPEPHNEGNKSDNEDKKECHQKSYQPPRRFRSRFRYRTRVIWLFEGPVKYQSRFVFVFLHIRIKSAVKTCWRYWGRSNATLHTAACRLFYCLFFAIVAASVFPILGDNDLFRVYPLHRHPAIGMAFTCVVVFLYGGLTVNCG